MSSRHSTLRNGRRHLWMVVLLCLSTMLSGCDEIKHPFKGIDVSKSKPFGVYNISDAKFMIDGFCYPDQDVMGRDITGSITFYSSTIIGVTDESGHRGTLGYYTIKGNKLLIQLEDSKDTIHFEILTIGVDSLTLALTMPQSMMLEYMAFRQNYAEENQLISTQDEMGLHNAPARMNKHSSRTYLYSEWESADTVQTEEIAKIKMETLKKTITDISDGISKHTFQTDILYYEDSSDKDPAKVVMTFRR